MCDKLGDQKMREKHVVDAVFNDDVMFLCMIAIQAQHNCAFRGQMEPTRL